MADGQFLEAMERDVSREVESPTTPSLGLVFNQLSYDWLSIVASFNKKKRIKHGVNQFIFLDLVKKREPKIGLTINAWFFVWNHRCQAYLTQIVNLIENLIDMQRLVNRSLSLQYQAV